MRYTTTAIAIILAASASAQWTVVNLHPTGATGSYAFGVTAGQQVGHVIFPSSRNAVLWSGTAASWVDLNPAGVTSAVSVSVGGGQQVGSTDVGGAERASLWSGTAASWVDLNPAGASQSIAKGVNGGKQVGWATVGGGPRAGWWSGTAGSWVSLHPAGASWSFASGTDSSQQVGQAVVGGHWRASLWSGTAGSWVNLHPAGSFDFSEAFGVHGGQQVGSAWTSPFDSHAGLWNGTAGSWVDLHPAVASESVAYGVHGGRQVGYAKVSGVERASLWSATAGSWVDLNAFLPAGFTSSFARGISNDGAFTSVAGYGYNSTTMRDEALMWVSRSVAPVSYSLVRGIATAGNLASLLNSDNNRLVIRPGIVFTTGEPPVQIRVDATAPASFPNGIAFSVESSATFGNAQQKIWLWNYVIGDYELVDTRLATITDDVTNVTIRTNSSRFIQPGTLAIRALVSYEAIGPAFAYPWSARIDKAWWTFPG